MQQMPGLPSASPNGPIGKKRGLAAVMFTDMVGYTAMGQKNELLALELLEEHRSLVRPLFPSFEGREIKTIGDAFLVEFPDPVLAVKCAYEMQRLLHERNMTSGPTKKIVIRIGINAGVVFYGEEGKDAYGSSVNIASRVEALAEPGGICITVKVYDLVKNTTEYDYENLGEHDLKNVEAPVGIFRVNLPWTTSGRVGHGATRPTLPARPYSALFVDREAERSKLLSLLDELLANAGVTGPRVIMIEGEAGVGKTRLLDWFISECMQRGVYVARGYCQAGLAIPYFPFSEALGKFLTELQARSDLGSVDLANWLGTSAKAGISRSSERNQMFEGTVRLLARLATKNPLVLGLEDVQWADASTLALLHYIARNTAGLNALVICTYRVEEVPEESGPRVHPLRETLSLMSRAGLYEKMALGRMGDDDIRGVVTSILGGVPLEAVDSLVNESGGNPLYAVEYARLLKEGTPGHQAGRTASAVPASVQAVIKRRLGRLDRRERRLIDCASLIGERFDSGLVSDALGLDRLAVLEDLDGVARETRILREELEGEERVARFIFDHAKVREIAQMELSQSLKKELHARIARAVEAGHREERVEEIVFHYRQGGVQGKVQEYGVAAGDRARARFAYPEAVEFYSWALEDIPAADESGSTLRQRALLGRADAYGAMGISEKCLRDAKEVLKLAAEKSVRVHAISLCADSSFDIGQFTESLGYCKSQELGGDEEGVNRTDLWRIRMIGARISGYRGDLQRAIYDSSEVAGEMKAAGERREYAHALLQIKEFQLSTLDVEGALKSSNEAESILGEIGDMESEMSASQSLAGIFSTMGEVAKAEEKYSRAAELGKKLGLYGTLAWLYLYWGLMYEAAEEYERALDLSLKALENAELSGLPYAEAAAWANLTRGFSRANRTKDAERAYSKVTELFQGHGIDASLTLKSAVERAKGFYHAMSGKRGLADAEYASSIGLLAGAPLGPRHEADTRAEYAKILVDEGRTREAKEQLSAALEIYQRLGNGGAVHRIQGLLSRLNNSNV